MKIIPLLLAVGLAVGSFVAPNVPAAPEVGAVDVVAAPLASGVVRPGENLIVTGTITNRTAQPLAALDAAVYVSSKRVDTRSALAQWLSDDPSVSGFSAGDALGTVSILNLGVSQARAFSISVPATALTFLTGKTGAFPLEVRVTAENVTLATQRSAVSWVPDGVIPRVNVAVATPLTAPPSSTGLLDAETLDTLTSPDGELYDYLEMAVLHSVALGVDPMIIASIRLLGDDAPVSAREWLERLENVPNDVFTLTYADSDQLLLHRAGATAPIGPISFPDAENVAPAPQETLPTQGSTPSSSSDEDVELTPGEPTAVRTTIDGLAWPASKLQSEDDLDFLAEQGTSRTLLSSSELSGSSIDTPNISVGKHRITVSDDQLSMLMRAAAQATTDGQWASAIANLTATLAVTAEQSPSTTVVATFAREVSPNSRLVGNTLTVMETLPWVNSTALRNALNAAPASGTLSVQSGDDESDTGQVPLIKELISSEKKVTEFSSVADNPQLVTGPQRLELLALVSAVWAGDRVGWQAAVGQHLTDNSELLDSVYIPEGSFINFPLEKGNLPITVKNELGVPVTVYVTVRAERAILKVTDPWVELKVEADSQTKVFVPVESIANGEVLTTVRLSSGTGVQISKPTIVTLNVQAGWETTATVVLAVLVVLLFGAGLWRTVMRRRSSRAERDSGIAAE